MLATLLLGTIVVMRGWPDTAAARWLRRRVVEPLARALARTTRTHVVFAILLVAIVVAASEYLAMAGPLDVGLVFVWDLAAYVDIVAATVTIAAVARGRAGWTWVRAALPRARPRARPRPRACRSRQMRTPRRDDRDRHARAVLQAA